jgi:hypothetical protein
MITKKSLENRIRGWLPKEPIVIYANKQLKPRWRKPIWIAFILVSVVALAFVTYAGVQTYLRYSNPRLDVTASYFEKTLNCSAASVGDVVEVKVRVGWHGYVIPEFKRDVKIIDPFPKGNFVLVNGTNVFEYKGYGGSDQFTYSLRIIAEGNTVELPKPRLYLDNVEVSLEGTSPTLKLQNSVESR